MKCVKMFEKDQIFDLISHIFYHISQFPKKVGETGKWGISFPIPL